jgi:nitroimidazol reductase NimA-like FMN-containing flavoprotein (pyridoxamine 5'-phosphate oxidase superfamily)
MDVDRNGLEVLDRDECLALLASVSFGRVGLSMSALPVVLPVNFRLVEDQIVFSTAPGSKLRAATDHAVIAFEADHIDPLDHAGWSVLATGMARAVTDPGERDRFVRSGVPRWLSGGEGQLVVVGTGVISGRRLRHDIVPVGVAGAARSARMDT